MSRRLIDADALIESMTKFSNATGEDMTHGIFYAHIAPTIDAVPVIRCKDCKYRITANCERFGIKRYTQSDSFCSWAEPKDTTEEVRKQLKDMEQRREMDRKK